MTHHLTKYSKASDRVVLIQLTSARRWELQEMGQVPSILQFKYIMPFTTLRLGTLLLGIICNNSG